MEKYSFTAKLIRYKQSKCPVDDYEQLLKDWKSKYGCKFLKHVYEVDSKKRIHCHAIVEIPSGTYRKKMMDKRYHIRVDPIYNEIGWCLYMAKAQPSKG